MLMKVVILIDIVALTMIALVSTKIIIFTMIIKVCDNGYQ